MLHNPKWTPLTLDHFIGWLATKPHDEYVGAGDPKYCFFGQYFREHGFNYIIDLFDIENAMGLPRDSSYIVSDCATFGEALVKFKELKCHIEATSSPAKQS